MRIILRPAMCGQSVKKKYLTDCPHSCMITQVKKMERIVEQTLLYDFYGELLTEHQKAIYEDVVFNDLSLSEVAGDRGITRQGVHDLIRRCDKILTGYEEKLHLIEKFMQTKSMVEEIKSLAGEYRRTTDMGCISRIEQIAGEISSL